MSSVAIYATGYSYCKHGENVLRTFDFLGRFFFIPLKQNMIIISKICSYNLPHELPNHSRFIIVWNKEMLWKPQNCLKSKPTSDLSWSIVFQGGNFGKIDRKLLNGLTNLVNITRKMIKNFSLIKGLKRISKVINEISTLTSFQSAVLHLFRSFWSTLISDIKFHY